MIKDVYYVQACENAREDFQLFRIRRSDAEVEAEAQVLRNAAHKKVTM